MNSSYWQFPFEELSCTKKNPRTFAQGVPTCQWPIQVHPGMHIRWKRFTLTRDYFVYASNQWDTTLQSNGVYNWLGTYTKTIPAWQCAWASRQISRQPEDVQYIPRNMHTVTALQCFVVVIHWLIFPYPSGLLHWHCGNLTIAPVPAKQPRWIWINTSCEFIMNECITTTKQSTTKPCAYFLGYTVYPRPLFYIDSYMAQWSQDVKNIYPWLIRATQCPWSLTVCT